MTWNDSVVTRDFMLEKSDGLDFLDCLERSEESEDVPGFAARVSGD